MRTPGSLFDVPVPDLTINRTPDAELAENLEAAGHRVFNPARTSLIANDKQLTYEFAQGLEIPVMHTIRASILGNPEFPRVFKPVDGHGGDAVELIENEEQARIYLEKYRHRTILSQQVVDCPGIDVRVYVLNQRIVAAMARLAPMGEFLANFTRGGRAWRMEPDERMREVVDKLGPELGNGLYGIDFLRHNNSWVLSEIEDVVGTRMLYAHTDIDIAYEHLKVLLEQS